MTVIIFIIVLAVLIFAHELGHFLTAKATGMKVDEFAIGFPPKVFSFTKGETTYSLNAIPFGGYVKIPGEDYEEAALKPEESDRLFYNKPKWAQVLVLVSGVLFNVIFAWILISIGFMAGLPSSASQENSFEITDPKPLITAVVPGSPAQEAGLKAGDEIVSIVSDGETLRNIESIDRVQESIRNADEELMINVLRGEEEIKVDLLPEEGVVDGKRAIGVGLDMVGIARLPAHQALWEGAKTTVFMTGAVAVGLWNFIADAVTGTADLSQVAGPVGIATLVGDASRLGFVYLLSFTAIISIHLAIINLVPFPALDGGRLLFVIIEKIKGSPIKPKIANALNVVGFSLLILLMIVITVSDIWKLF